MFICFWRIFRYQPNWNYKNICLYR